MTCVMEIENLGNRLFHSGESLEWAMLSVDGCCVSSFTFSCVKNDTPKTQSDPSGASLNFLPI